MSTEVNIMKGGVLKVYNADFYEFQRDGYFDNNTTLDAKKYVFKFYFDSELTITGVTAGLYKINRDNLKEGNLTESKVKTLNISYEDSTIYLPVNYHNEHGMFRVIITATYASGTKTFWTELFCIEELETDNYTLINGDNYTLINTDNYKLI